MIPKFKKFNFEVKRACTRNETHPGKEIFRRDSQRVIRKIRDAF